MLVLVDGPDCQAIAVPRGPHPARIDVPTLIIQGDDDPIVPPAASKRQAESIPGAPHGPAATHEDRVNADPLQFIRG